MSQNQKEQKPTLPSKPLPLNTQWIIVGGVVLAVALSGLYYVTAGSDRDLADVTRPPVGFEAFEEGNEETLVAMEESTEASDASEDSEEGADMTALRIRVHELEQLLQEKEHAIIELSQQLSEGQQQMLEAPAPQPPVHGQRTHTVKKGETLSEIARSYYGSGSRWKEIYDANSAQLGDKNRVRVGTVLIIPD